MNQNTNTAPSWEYDSVKPGSQADAVSMPQKTIDNRKPEPFVYGYNFFDLYFPFSNARKTPGEVLTSLEKSMVFLSAMGLLVLLTVATPFMVLAEFMTKKRNPPVSFIRFITGFIQQVVLKEIAVIIGLITTTTLFTLNVLKIFAAPFYKSLFEKKKSQPGNFSWETGK